MQSHGRCTQGCAEGGVGGMTPIQYLQIFAGKLVKSQPCCKRVGHGIFRELFLATIAGQKDPTPQRKVLRHITVTQNPHVIKISLIMQCVFSCTETGKRNYIDRCSSQRQYWKLWRKLEEGKGTLPLLNMLDLKNCDMLA